MTSPVGSLSRCAAIGIPLGRIVLGDPASLGGGVVCSQGEFIELSGDLYRVWTRALIPHPAEDLARWADDAGMRGTALVQELAGEGLLAALPGDEAWAGWPGRHRLVPLGLGLGNRSANQAEFVIADGAGEPRVAVNLATYCAWATSATTASLAAAIEKVVAASDIPEGLVHAQVRDQLPWLLSARTAYLDVV